MRPDFPRFRRIFWNKILARTQAAGACARSRRSFVDRVDWPRFFDSAPSPAALFSWASAWGSQPAFADFGPLCGPAIQNPEIEAAARAFCAVLSARPDEKLVNSAAAKRSAGAVASSCKVVARSADASVSAPESTPASCLRDYFFALAEPEAPSAFRWALADAFARCADLAGWRLMLPCATPREPLAGPGTPSLWFLSLDRAFSNGVATLLSATHGGAVGPDPSDIAHFFVREAEKERRASESPGLLSERMARMDATAVGMRLVSLGAQIHDAGPWAPGRSLLDVMARSEAGGSLGEFLLRSGASAARSSHPAQLIRLALEHNSPGFAEALLEAGALPRSGREVELSLRRARPALALAMAKAGGRFQWLEYLRGAPAELSPSPLFSALDAARPDSPDNAAGLDERFWSEHLRQRSSYAGLKEDFERFDRFAQRMRAHAERATLLKDPGAQDRRLSLFGVEDVELWRVSSAPCAPKMQSAGGLARDASDAEGDDGRGDASGEGSGAGASRARRL